MREQLKMLLKSCFADKDIPGVCVDETFAEQHQEVHVLLAVVNLVQDDVCPFCQTSANKICVTSRISTS